MKQVFILGALFIYVQLCVGQDLQQMNTDQLFELAQSKAFNGERAKAREILNILLTKSAAHADARTLLARTYAWDGNYAEARTNLEQVIAKDTDYIDAYRALSDVENWDDKYEAALGVSERGLSIRPTDEDLLANKASALFSLHREAESVATCQQILELYPANKKAADLLKKIRSSSKKYSAGINYGIDVFSRSFDPAHNTSLQLGRINRWGSLIARANLAQRFSTTGFQAEVDAYPAIAKGVYMYLNYGCSSTDLFPEHRAGAEVFAGLGHGLEVSAGLRYLFFSSESEVTMYTGSLGWYVGNFLISGRTFITPDVDAGTSVSGLLSVRRYLSDADSYLGLTAGIGFSPDIRRLQTTTGISGDEIYILESQRFGLSYQKLFPNDIIFLASADLARQELIFDTDNFVWITSLSVGVRKKF